MDMSKLSESDLQALAAGDMSKVSNEALTYLSGASPELRATAAPAAAKPPSIGEKVLRGMKDPLDGAAQLFEKVMPEGFNSANRSVNNWLADKTGLLAHMPTPLEATISGGKPGVEGLIANQETAYQNQRKAAGEEGLDGYRLLGNAASPVNLALAARLPAAASMAGRIGVGAAGGAATSALTPVEKGDFWPEKGKQVAAGALFGGAVPVVAGAIGRVISPNASINPQLQLLKDEGVRPTVGQSLGGWANTVEEKLQSLPIMGDAIAAARQRARDQFNTAAINRSTSEVGQRVQGHGQGAVAEAGNLISEAYNRGRAALGHFQIDPIGRAEITNLQNMTQQLPRREQGAFSNIFDAVSTEISPNGSIMADSFKRIDSKLGTDAARFSGSTDAYQKQLGAAIGELQNIITNNARRANPTASRMLDNADRAWANLVPVEGAAKAAVNTQGVFTPSQLNLAIRGADKSVRDRATARGMALMQDLGNAGQLQLGNKVPNSATADRLMMGGGALSAYLLNPAIPASLIAGAGAYTPPIQSLLRGAVSSRPQQAEAIAAALNQAAPYLVPAAASVGTRMTGQ